MTKMTKKDYELVAGIIAKLPKNTTITVVIALFATEFAKDNPLFSVDKFIGKCLDEIGGKVNASSTQTILH